MELFNKTLMVRINELWNGTKIVHYMPHHRQNEMSMERTNGDFNNMLYAQLRDVKECSQWVSELPYVQTIKYSKNIAFHSGINCIPFSVYIFKITGGSCCRFVPAQ